MALKFDDIYSKFVKLQQIDINAICKAPFSILIKIDYNIKNKGMTEKEATYNVCKAAYYKYYSDENSPLYRHPTLKKCFDVLAKETDNNFDFLYPVTASTECL